MNASKENARRAQNYLDALTKGGTRLIAPADIRAQTFLRSFLESAAKKLPSEAAFKADRERASENASLRKQAKAKKNFDPANPDACRGPISMTETQRAERRRMEREAEEAGAQAAKDIIEGGPVISIHPFSSADDHAEVFRVLRNGQPFHDAATMEEAEDIASKLRTG